MGNVISAAVSCSQTQLTKLRALLKICCDNLHVLKTLFYVQFFDTSKQEVSR